MYSVNIHIYILSAGSSPDGGHYSRRLDTLYIMGSTMSLRMARSGSSKTGFQCGKWPRLGHEHTHTHAYQQHLSLSVWRQKVVCFCLQTQLYLRTLLFHSGKLYNLAASWHSCINSHSTPCNPSKTSVLNVCESFRFWSDCGGTPWKTCWVDVTHHRIQETRLAPWKQCEPLCLRN